MSSTSSSIPAFGTDTASAAPRELAWRRVLRRQPTLVIGLAVLLLILAGGVLAPVWWTGDPQQMRPAPRLQPPSAVRRVGSDQFGRAASTRPLYGARVSLVVGAAVALLSLALGTMLGLVIGFYRRLDAVVMGGVGGRGGHPAIFVWLGLLG